MTGKGRELADVMERRKVDILCVQETRWKGSKARSIGAGFKLFYYGVDSKRNGVGVVLKEEFVRNVLEVKRVSDRVMSLKLEIEGVMLNVVSGYAPQVGCELEEKERFWSELDEVMESIPTGERVVIGADFNGHVGEGNTGDEEVMGKFGVKERNLEGQMVVDFAKRMDMGVVNTYFQKREEHRVTYKSGGRRTQVDYILCRRGNLKEISDCKVVVGESVARQHRMVVCRMTLMVCKKKRSEIEKKTKWWKLKKEECCEEFRQKLRQALGGQVVLPDDWETTAEVIRETGRKVLGVSSGRRKEDKETWWWNEEVQDSIQRKRLAKKKWDMDRTEENRQEYKELQRRVKREVSKAKQKAYDELYTRLDTREGEKDLYRLARQRDRDGKDVQQVRVIKDRDGRVLTSEESVQRRWKEYFEELMNEENEREKRVEGVNSVEQKVDKIRKDEVRKALKRMKSGKAVGPDDIPVEVWKCLGEAAVEFLASLFNRVLENLEKAYDRVPREELWYCMRKSGIAEKYVRVVQDMYERSRTVVRCAVGQTEEFNVEVGLHQGSALSPFLFAIVMDQLSEEVRQESPWTMMFADDIVICSESREQVEENLERWRFALERRGMKVSRSKTEYMCVNEREGSGTVRLQGEEVKKVQEFKYLGSTVQSNGECGKEVKKRVQAGWNGWRKVSGVLCDQKISARIKGKVYRTVVRPAMLYGLETVSLRKRQESELEVAELKMLRFSLGVTRLDRIRNEYIRGTAHVGRLGDKVREARLRWFGHVQRREMEGVLTNIVGNIYPGTDLKLTCNPPENNSIKWTLNGIQLQQSAKYAINNVELTVKNAGPSDSGCISCDYKINKEECQTTEQTKQVTCQLTQPISESSYNSKTIRILVLCLIIEIIIWKLVTRNDTSYMRHVSIVNIAVSLLIADICFIIGANVVNKGDGPCSTATFFMHFFYLALFFWMLLSALLLLYRTLMVFSRMNRGAMMGIGFTVGYGAPLIIAVITVASTAGNKGYIQQDYNCWLNWNKTKALLAFVIPALTIVAINFLVLIVVLCKMLRRGVNASTQPDEKHPLVVIAKCVAILTPLFGLTWGFGIGTLVSLNFGIHVVFAFLNSLQGFFILLFGILLDSKVREALAGKFSLRNISSGRTRFGFKCRVKREVSKAKQKAYDELYTRLDTREGEKDLYRLARQRDRDGKDVQQVRVIKDRDGRVLTSEESVQRRWKEYFEELMNEENEREKRVEGVNSVEQKVDKIRKDEVRKALKRMKSGKAVGPDDIPVEVWKCLGEAAVEFLASLFNRVLESERMPEEWRRSVLVPIFKNKGDVQSCSNYRGIKLMSHTMKLWERVVEARLRKVVEIYLEKAYDRVPREELWYCMRKSGVAENYVRVVQDMYERSRTVVRCAVVMDQLSEEVRQESPWTMMFADDIVICSESREQVEENLERWRFALERRGMKVSRNTSSSSSGGTPRRSQASQET
ncbi:hypothetical protein QTP86_007171 [Hemibagrus guttatus]|nr:hypothetical protein QTP86_007171 [Hemibagrus guttatus]